MKSRIFLIFALFVCALTTSLGQIYNTIFGQDTTEWAVPFCQLGQGLIVDRIAIEDTMIYGQNYKKVGTIEHNSIDYKMMGLLGVTNGFLREDTISGKVWFLGTINNNTVLDTVEYLISDMSLSLGDSFVIHLNYGDSITVVDSVYYEAGAKYIQLNFRPTEIGPNFKKVTFVEGVGTNYGFAYMHFNTAHNLCPCLSNYEKDGSTVYFDHSCSVVNNISKVEHNNFLNVNVFPHPISGRSILKFENSTQAEVLLVLYDVTGNVIERYKTNNDYFELRKERYTGFCYYQLQINEKKGVGGKLLFLD